MPAPTKAVKKVLPPVKKIAKRVVSAAPTAIESLARARAAAMPPIDPNADSDLALAMREMLIGGETRSEVMHRVRDALAGVPTRTGKEKPTSTIMNHALNRAEEHGYRIEQSWKLVPIEGYVAPEVEPKPIKKVAKVAKVRETAVVPTRARKVAKKAIAATPLPPRKTVRKPPPAVAPAAPPTKRLGIKKPGAKVAAA